MGSFYVKILDKSDSRFAFVTLDNCTTWHRAEALAFPDRATALAAADRLREERPSCEARVVNEKGDVRQRTVTESHPGTVEVGKALDLPVSLVAALAGVPGCPVVKGGRGHRFASVQAFKGFLEGMTLEQRLCVPAYAANEKGKVIGEIAKLAWGITEAGFRELMRKPYAELLRVRAWWEAKAKT